VPESSFKVWGSQKGAASIFRFLLGLISRLNAKTNKVVNYQITFVMFSCPVTKDTPEAKGWPITKTGTL
jgi:hypothetical protein